MSLTTYAANKLLDHAIGKTAYTMPTVSVALFSTAPTIAGGGTELSYTGYVRKSTVAADWTAAGSGADANANPLGFPANTGGTTPTAAYWATYDASTGGNMIEFGTISPSAVIGAAVAPSFAAGQLTRSAS